MQPCVGRYEEGNSFIDGSAGVGIPVGDYPDLDLYHCLGTLEYRVTDDLASPWTVKLNGGAGATAFHFSDDTFLVSGGGGR